MVQTLTEFYEADPGCCVTRLRWRPSRNGGRVIAQASATNEQIAATEREANKARNPKSNHIPRIVAVKTHRGWGRGAKEAAQIIVGHLAANGLKLSEGPEGRALEDGQWRASRNRNDNITGSISIAIRNQETARKIIELLHERAIEVGQDLVTIIATEDRKTLEGQTNGRRGGRRDPPPRANA